MIHNYFPYRTAYLCKHNACCEISGCGKGDLKHGRTRRRGLQLNLDLFCLSIKHSKSENGMPNSMNWTIDNECEYICRPNFRLYSRNQYSPESRVFDIYWSIFLSDQQGLCRFFRKHKTVKNLKTATIKQVIIHLSNVLKCSFFQ